MAHTPQPAPVSRTDFLGRIFPWLLPVLLFFSITGTSRFAAVVLAVVAILFSIGRVPVANLRNRLSPLTAAVFFYSLICLLSGLWCHFGLYAARESAKTLAAFSIFALVLMRVKREHLRGLLKTLDGVLAVIALLCIDASSLQLLSRGFSWVMALFKAGYPLETMGYETGVRITGIFSNANVSAGLLAFGLILSLYLIRTEESPRTRLVLFVGLGVESLAFFLSFSMGAMASFGLTCLVYLLCSGKGNRLSLLILMLESVLATVICSFAATPFLGISGAAALVPILLSLLCGPAIWVLDRFAGQPLLAVLKGRDKAVAVAAVVLVALTVCYGVLAYNLTGDLTLESGVTISRAIYPAAGEYTLTCDGDDVQAVIYSQTEAELMMHTNTVLYEGSLSDAAFTVPEGSRVVWFQLSGTGTVRSVTLSDGTQLPLGYTLLPEFAANRIQGLWANQNFIQRLVFFRDGLKLWQASPLIGWGVGGVEGQLTSVQSFYYESKYIHNQFIQIMDEAGVLGLAAFVGMLGSAVWMLTRRRKDADPLLAMLAACLTMMVAHSMTEVVWSTQIYQSAVFVLFAVLILWNSSPEAAPVSKPAKGRVAAGAAWGLIGIFALLLSGHLLAAGQLEKLDTDNISSSEFLSAMETMDRLDVYDDSDYKVNLMANYLRFDTAVGRGMADHYAQQLLANQEYDTCYQVAAYYYLPLRDFDGFFEAIRVGLLQERSNPAAWNSAFHLFQQAFDGLEADDMEAYVSGTVSIGALMDETNEILMAPITLDEGNAALLACARTLTDVSGEAAQAVLASLLSE